MDLLASWRCGCCDIHQAIIWLHSATRLQITTTASVMIDRKMQHQPDGNDIIDMTTAPLLCPHNYNNLNSSQQSGEEERWVSSVDYWIWIICADRITH